MTYISTPLSDDMRYLLAFFMVSDFFNIIVIIVVPPDIPLEKPHHWSSHRLIFFPSWLVSNVLGGIV